MQTFYLCPQVLMLSSIMHSTTRDELFCRRCGCYSVIEIARFQKALSLSVSDGQAIRVFNLLTDIRVPKSTHGFQDTYHVFLCIRLLHYITLH